MRSFEPQIRASSLIGLENLRLDGAASLPELMERVNLQPSALKTPDKFISYLRFSELLEMAAKEWKRPWLGFDFAMSLDKSMPTLPGAILAAKLYPNFGEFGKAAMKYWALHSTASYGELIEDYDENSACLRSIVPSYLYQSRHEAQSAAGQGLRLCRIVTNCPDLAPTCVHLKHSRQNVEGFDEIANSLFKCPVHFDMEHDQFIFPKEYLNLKIQGNIGFFGGFLRKYVQWRIDNQDSFQSSARHLVLNAIPNFFGTDGCNFENVADLLQLHPKALQRMLASEGTNFKDLSVFVKIEKAKDLLCTSNLSVEHIAKYLTYVGSAPFSAAFKRETSYSPLEYRNKFVN